MPTTNVKPGSSQELQCIADALARSKKVIVVTGAGISTNCGIPDFRSENGLYSLIQAQYDKSLENPPWEQTNTFDIDDRPKKRKRPSYFYEVVAPDGNVVGVIDDEEAPSSQPPSRDDEKPQTSNILPSSSPLSSRSTTPSLSLSYFDIPHYQNRESDTSVGSSTRENNSPSLRSLRSSRHRVTKDCSPQPNALELPSPACEPEQPQKFTRKSNGRFTRKFSSLADPPTAATSRTSSPTRSLRSGTVRTFTPEPTTAHLNGVPIDDLREVLPNKRRQILQREASSFTSSPTDEEPSTQSSQTSSRTLPNMKGRDLFDSMVWQDPFTTSIFYMFISSLRQKIQNDVTTTTETHAFIRTLRDGGRLVRNYTQNIDCLEERLGLCTELTRGPGHRARFHSKTQREPRPEIIDEQSAHNGGVEVVLLHGSLVDLRCGLCGKLSPWSEADRESATLSGQAPDCPYCTEYNAHRTGRGRRELAVGRLRPDIVLYGEEHPHANLVGPLITHDIGIGPDVLLIMGTSLKVHGLKIMVKEFAKAVHGRGGTVVFVNRTKPPESTWGDVIDYWVEWDCDAWVSDLKQRREDIWLPQGTIEEPKKRQSIEKKRQSIDRPKPRESIGETKPGVKKSRPQCMRDDKMNGAYVTFKILDTLRMFPDDAGNIASRPAHPDKFQSRTSLGANRESRPELSLPTLTIPAGVAKQKPPAPKRKTKSMSAADSLPKAIPQIKKKRQSMPSKPTKSTGTTSKDEQDEQDDGPQSMGQDESVDEQRAKDASHVANVLEKWKELLRIVPTLPKHISPQERLDTLKHNLGTNANRFPAYSYSNHFPNLGAKNSDFLERINLLTHPPRGDSLPPMQNEPPRSPNTQTNDNRRTSRRLMNQSPEQLTAQLATAWGGAVRPGRVLPSLEGPQDLEDLSLLPTPPASGASSDPITPTASESQPQRIKRMGSIGRILSSPVDESEWHDASEVLSG
ncbi:hypothetical protein HYFRA_00006252 [Hymenoscyphus fraxineus]|uniref:Deacetylase sirtuin-type domain-containing protein n=1 Tax=Hymenoscyphus fraxineus TaxID=746836 RepID=A0A9N9LCJ0_9HELO|nr:hypothetical protein HYFRA_00006252 [Hymenoscyphus fraxineus]